MLSPRLMTLVLMIVAAAATRLMPPALGIWNFTGVGAICLFGGAYFRRRWLAVLVPLAALAVSDLLLALLLYGFRGFPVMAVSYVLFALTAGIGMSLRGRVTFGRVTAAAVAASVLFFLVSNFHVWLTGHDGVYPYTPAGLLACYAAGLPFAQSMLLGNLFYCGLLFGGYELLAWKWPALREAAMPQSAGGLRTNDQ